MEIQSWIIGQVVIDLVIAALLLWFVLTGILRKKNGIVQDTDAAFKRSEKILVEMREISQDFEKNLIEKRELSRSILKHLDEGLERARESSLEIQKIIREYSTDMVQPGMIEDTEQTKLAIRKLLSKGMSRQKISHKLNIPIGEIDLILKLQGE